MKAREVNHQIEANGGEILRQKGSHRFYVVTQNGVTSRTTVAQHGNDIPVGTLAQIQRDLEPALGKGWLKK